MRGTGKTPFGFFLGIAALTFALGLYLQADAQTGQATVLVQDDPLLGLHLTDPNGRTLYLYRNDRPGASTCNRNCLNKWEVFSLPSGDPLPPAGLPGELGIVLRDDGARQVTYGGWPLYRSKDDSKPGEAKGNAVGGKWYVANVGMSVQVRNVLGYGNILVGPAGMTLYTFDNDVPDSIACDDGCSINWQPLVVAEKPIAPTNLMVNVGFFRRKADDDNGARFQVTYKGKPLYYWSHDTAPGEVAGDGNAGLWHVSRP